MTDVSDDVPELRCSARGCGADAVWGLRWNNPKIHTPERRKVWLACPDHRTSLEEYLGVRGFHLDTVAVGDLTATDG
ncbi:MAG: hypothetical protein HGA44_03910 [Cellulomonadaceae bacterium]|nr:hypothetical protein [Cellulomonadaceae bacterium]